VVCQTPINSCHGEYNVADPILSASPRRFAMSNSSSRIFAILLLLAGGGYLFWMWNKTSGPRGFDVGQVAPEIVGTDIDGAKFQLSDYRGKVVVLDFWGHW
jgi:hypothetical protein